MTGPTLEQLASDPHPVLAALRERSPVCWVEALGGHLVTSRALVLQALRDPGAFTVDDPRFTTARVLGASMLSTEGEEHARHRDPFARAWRRDAILDAFGRAVAEKAAALVAALAPGDDLRAALAVPLAVWSMQRALGLERLEPERVLALYADIVAAVDALSGGRAMPASGPAASAQLRAALERTVADRAPSLTAGQASSNAAVLLFGGIETTEGTIAALLWHVLSTPGVADALRADPARVAVAVEESLRLEPSAAVVDRYATADCELGGVPIAAGDLVVLSLAAANRDPAAFPAPDAFDLARDAPQRHLTFAAGPHVCLGMHLARLEAAAALGAVLRGLPEDLALVPGGSGAPRGLVFRKPPAVRVTWAAGEDHALLSRPGARLQPPPGDLRHP